MPSTFDKLLSRGIVAISELTARLQAGDITLDVWHDQIRRILTRYHTGAMLIGLAKNELPKAGAAYLASNLARQFGYLNGFAIELAQAPEWKAGYNARAALYAEGIKAPYWAGETKLLPLPDMPGSGTTQCKTRCGCKWHVETIDAEKGDYDAYWKRHKKDSCQTCRTREEDWAPLHIRGGELQ
jgi:hypothetical protein